MKRSSIAASCLCGSARPYIHCCGPLHDGAKAPDAERLMRSRYAAYVLGLRDYLLATWHPDTRPAELEWTAGQPKWLGLDIRATAQLEPDQAIVEFVARYRQGGGKAQRLHEVSRFQRIEGRWFYVDGQFPGTAGA